MNESDRPSRAYRFGDYRLDAAEGLFHKDGRELRLTPTLLEVLLTIVEGQGRILDKQWLMNRVWPGRVVEEGNLARNISTLRRILNDDPQNPRYIETIPRRGYRFIADVSTSSRLESKPVSAASSELGATAELSGEDSATPLRQAYFKTTLGRAAALLTVLAILPAIVLTTAVLQNDSVAPIRSLAQGIEAIVRPEVSRSAAPRRVDPRAYAAYQWGSSLKDQRRVDKLHSAIDHFEQAVEIDAEYAEAYAAMADTYLTLASWQGPSRTFWANAREAANRALAIDSNVALAHLVIAGARLCHDLDQAAADVAFLRALELDPGHATARRRYAYSLMTQGRFTQSLEEAQRSIDLDPVSLANNMMLGQILHFAGRYEAARAQLLRTLELDDDYPEAHRMLGRVYLQMGMPNDAISALENALAAGGGRGVIGELGYVYALVDRTQDALRQMELLETLSNEGRDSAFGRALIYYGLGEIDATLEWLQEAYDERDFRMILLAVDPLWDELRKDPRFQRLLLTIGLTADVQA